MKVIAKMLPTSEVLRRHKLQEDGPVQALIDSECMRYMNDYMPRRQAGELEHMMAIATVIGSGEIDTPGPYAHYLYEGILFVDPETGSSWAKKNAIKVKTEKELTYAGAPMRGKKWFDRMIADHKDDILKAAQALVDRGGRT